MVQRAKILTPSININQFNHLETMETKSWIQLVSFKILEEIFGIKIPKNHDDMQDALMDLEYKWHNEFSEAERLEIIEKYPDAKMSYPKSVEKEQIYSNRQGKWIEV